MADATQQSGVILAFSGVRPGATGADADPQAALAALSQLRANQQAQQQYEPVGVLDDPTPADTERGRRMKQALDAFEGRLPDPFPTNRNPKQPNCNAKSNRAEPIVTAGVDFLVGKDVTLQVEAQAEDETAPDTGAVATGDTGAQDFLDAFAEANDLMTTLAKHATNGGVFGHPFLKLVPARDAATPPRVVVLDPQLVRVECDPDDHTTALAYVIQYRSAVRYRDARTGRLQEKPIDKRQVIERVYDPATGEAPRDAQSWRITDQTRDASALAGAGPSSLRGGAGAGDWVTVAQSEWPYAQPPIFDNQNLPEGNEYWGRPDLTPDLIELNEVLNRTQSNVQKILDNHAGPLTYGINIGERSIDKDPSKILAFGEGAQLFNLEMHSDLASSLNYLAMLRANMDEQSRVPSVALGRQESLPRGNLSGVALELLFQPLLQKTEKKRRLYGGMLKRLCTFVLEYAGFGADVAVEIQWPNVLPHDPMADWQVAAEKNAMGVSKATILTENGYDPADELQRSADEKQQGVLSAQALFNRGQGLPGFPPTARGMLPSQQQPGQQSLATGASGQSSSDAQGGSAGSGAANPGAAA